MTTDLIADYVDQRDFTGLFVEELGWNRSKSRPRRITVSLEDGEAIAEEVATLKGVTVWACPVVPDGRAQREIDRHIKRESDERLTIFHDATTQQWKWPQTRDTAGAGAVRLVTHEHITGRKNPALAQRLEMVAIGLNEDPTVVEVNRRLRRAFDADTVTRQFYKSFAAHHDELCNAIDGIDDTTSDPSQSEIRWYGSLLMNRLMFIYFMQRKGFLDNDPNYLPNRLERLQAMERPGSFYQFYRDFLLPLFHSGLGATPSARQIDDPQIAALIGDVPYVNGGIFSEHIIEKTHDITVPDDVFAKIFRFFDSWQWHLDDQPSGNPEEINPDVLGYIFEQFINQKQQGAYYTKEDVTGYMTENTLIPVFLERFEEATGFNPWRLLAVQPDRYIWDSLRHGEDNPLPEAIETQAAAWPRPAWDSNQPSSEFALPGESWWMVVERRQYVRDLRRDIAEGKIQSAEAAVTANIDLENLAIDAIDAIDNPDDVVAAWQTLTAFKVIDPTCGSGAFLFASLNVLHALYSTVLDAARIHANTKPTGPLNSLLDAADKHDNVDYYLLKHAALNNIYGVDLMPEAVEITRLRLFLKLIAQVYDRQHIEPLPDLEFNIRPGNILVGALGEKEIRDRTDLINLDRVDTLVEQAAEASATYRLFADAQEIGDDLTARQTREELGNVTKRVRDVLDQWWHAASSPRTQLDAYLDVHRPFHWFIEFPEVFEFGGFDVVVGNPPYVQKQKVPYTYSGFRTDGAPDIYAPCTERAATILKPHGRMAFIVPHSLAYSGNFTELRTVLADYIPTRWVSSFARIPASLFGNEVRVRNSIILGKSGGEPTLNTSRCRRWVGGFRPHLTPTISYAKPTISLGNKWPMLDLPQLDSAFETLRREKLGVLGLDMRGRQSAIHQHPLHYKTNAYAYLSVFIDVPPVTNADGSRGEQSKMSTLWFASQADRDVAYALLVSKWMFSWWTIWGDDFDLTKEIIESFPIAPSRLPASVRSLILGTVPTIRSAQTNSPTFKKNAGKTIGNWSLAACRETIDEAEGQWVTALGLTKFMPAVELAFHSANVVTR